MTISYSIKLILTKIKRFLVVSALFFSALLQSSAANAISEISISAERIEHAQGVAKNTTLNLDLRDALPKLSLSSGFKAKSSPDWFQLKFNCSLASNLDSGRCSEGLIKSTHLEVPFSLELDRLSLNGKPDISATLTLNNANYSDEAGLHATEKFNGKFKLALQSMASGWAWQSQVDWLSGEVFWQPFYVAEGGHQLQASGTLTDGLLNIDVARLQVKNVGDLDVSGQLRLSDYQLLSLNGSAPSLDLAAAYPLLLKPMLEKSALSNIEVGGKAALQFSIKNAELKSFELGLHHIDVADINQKFAFYNINASLPWSYDEPKGIMFSFDSGELLNLPLAKTNIVATVNRFSLTSNNIRLPILDGALSLSDVSAARIANQWYWHLRVKLEPISMADFSSRLSLPRMDGTASAEIPLVTYAGGRLTTDGSLQLKVFNGTATVSQLVMQNPLGTTPKLNADIALRNFDLGALTRTFSFGAIEGKLDGDIKQLELQNWKPVKFDAVIQSSAGRYPRKISQRAVENISSLGGAGAAVAIQRSFLHFFEQFNYQAIGLNCKLRNDVCTMGGIASTPGGYVIVKGSGIPAITVMGYNQTVAWTDLLARIKRVTTGNTIIK
ncbi:MAG: hypothetical protein NTW57_03165 [Methylophilales bacterium]|nr:hypothetical protein [Methylophilales bacterium]